MNSYVLSFALGDVIPALHYAFAVKHLMLGVQGGGSRSLGMLFAVAHYYVSHNDALAML